MHSTTCIVGLLWAAAAARAQVNFTVQAADETHIQFTGTGQTRPTIALRHGIAVYVIGTVDCDWSGLIAIGLDGEAPITFNRRSCPNVTGQSLCEYPWFTATDLPNQSHTVLLNLTGPNPKSTPSGNIIADMRYIIYTSLNPNTPSNVTTAASAAPTATTAVAASSSSGHTHTGAIAGGVVGGVLLLLLIAIVLGLLWRQKAKNEHAREQADLLGDGTMRAVGGLSPYWDNHHTVPGAQHPSAMYDPVTVTFGPAAAPVISTPGSDLSKVEGGGFGGAQPGWQPYVDANSGVPGVAVAGTNSAPSSSAGGEFNPYAPPQMYANHLDAGVAAVRDGKGGVVPVTGPSPALSNTSGTGSHNTEDLVHRIASTVAAMMRGDGGVNNAASPPPLYQERS
ncbi:hypothetical protein FRB96_008376 [Tulasnella sp. 330]|nr:hypothetical protein FRB96_008376 [Tulasnella sp. 330]KAG8879753.1 hypothetical protein FRB97_001449 [Tulasnella sp. 331]